MKITIYIHEKELYKFNKLLKKSKNPQFGYTEDEEIFNLRDPDLYPEVNNETVKYTLKQKNGFSAAVTILYADFLNLTDSGVLKRKFL